MLNEIKGNLFNSSSSLAHCVSRDFAMSAGIAVTFSNLFGGKEELRNQNANIGEVAWLYRDGRYIYYLVTKENYWSKPTYESLRSSIRNLFNLCKIHGVTSLSIPKLGCGLDRLQWDKVTQILIEEWPHDINNFSLNVYYYV
jgi:O-acetyl-ADP-ribose deacetylase (regulator of RNase III)